MELRELPARRITPGGQGHSSLARVLSGPAGFRIPISENSTLSGHFFAPVTLLDSLLYVAYSAPQPLIARRSSPLSSTADGRTHTVGGR